MQTPPPNTSVPRSHNLKTAVLALIGLTGLAVILICVNLITGLIPLRFDATQDRLFTLSPGTLNILAKLDVPVTLTFYASLSSPEMPQNYKTYARQIRDLLEEMRKAAPQKIRVRLVEVQPDTEEEDQALAAGMQSRQGNYGALFFGLEARSIDLSEKIPFMDIRRQANLEYDIISAISRVMVQKKPVLGISSSLSIFGREVPPMFGQAGEPSWLLIDLLRQDFEVRDLGTDFELIDPDVDILFLVHPQNLSSQNLYAIDQFLMRGGRLLVCLDPFSLFAPMGLMGGGTPSGMEDMLKNWGVTYDPSRVVADAVLQTEITGQDGMPEVSFSVLSLTRNNIHPEAQPTDGITNVLMAYAGAFEVKPVDGLTATVLLHSSDQAQLVPAAGAPTNNANVRSSFEAQVSRVPLGVLLSGTFPSQFGTPQEEKEQTSAEKLSSGSNNSKPTPPQNEKEQTSDGKSKIHSKRSKPTMVILFGDSDFIHEAAGVRTQTIFGQRVVQYINDNFPLIQGSIDVLSGDTNLLQVRNRGNVRRPFHVVRNILARAEARYRAQIQELEAQKESTRRILQKLLQGQDENTVLTRSPQIQAEIDRYQAEQRRIDIKLREIRRQTRLEVEQLESRLFWGNLLAMPTVVVLAGLGFALYRRRKE